MTSTADNRRAIGTYLVLVFGLSSIFYALIIHAGQIGAANGAYVQGLMWCPGIAALLTCRRMGRSARSLGWTWKPGFQVASYVIPVAYATAAYVLVWLSGLGGFPNHAVLDQIAKVAGWGTMPAGLTLACYVLLRGTVGMVTSTATALGEEIGWRGFLVPELAKVTSFTGTAFISGLIWAVWHFPLLLFADYNNGTPAWYGLSCFLVLVVAISFVFAWMRLKSGSLWTGAFLHAAHNLWIQSIFTPLTTDTGRTKWVIDEFGFMLPLVAIFVAMYFWRRRAEVERAAS
ncbi:MAG: CPBP family intramembrane metalloprotease [Gemmatimonadaceae bacterium]|nr:CPBP family intramembrane metalloprotease [Gemmatimonadaceae bacterium]